MRQTPQAFPSSPARVARGPAAPRPDCDGLQERLALYRRRHAEFSAMPEESPQGLFLVQAGAGLQPRRTAAGPLGRKRVLVLEQNVTDGQKWSTAVKSNQKGHH